MSPRSYDCSVILRQGRAEKADQNEASEKHLRQAELAYKEIAKEYNFESIKCGGPRKIKTIDEIHQDVVKVIKKHL